MSDDVVKLKYVTEKAEELERADAPEPPSRRLPPTFPPGSRGGAPEWAQHHPSTASYPAALVSEETNALRRFQPRRSRWPEVVKFDERIGQVEERRGEPPGPNAGARRPHPPGRDR